MIKSLRGFDVFINKILGKSEKKKFFYVPIFEVEIDSNSSNVDLACPNF